MSCNRPNSIRRHTAPRCRSGHATLWVIICTPALLALFVLVSDIANLWMARAELENAVEAAALAGADQWGDGGDTAANRTTAHNRAKDIAEANLVLGTTITANANDNAANTNNNAVCGADVLLGTYTAFTETFDAGTVPPIADQRACRVFLSAPVNSLWVGFAGPFSVQATATAIYDSSTNTAKLVRVLATDDPCNAP